VQSPYDSCLIIKHSYGTGGKVSLGVIPTHPINIPCGRLDNIGAPRPDFGGNSGGGGKNLGEVQRFSSRSHGKLGLRMGRSQRRDICM
jgi:hypothetical protein